MNALIVKLWQIFLLLSFVFFLTTVSAQKNDTVFFLNGDRISGEIKDFQYGYLTYKTYGVSTVSIKYDKIATFFSNKDFEIIFKDGRRRFGSFATSHLDQFVNIVTTNDTLLTPLVEVVEITPIKKRFWKRLSGNVDLGYSYTKASTLSHLNFSSNLKYQQKNYFTRLQLNSNITDQKNQDRADKNDATLTIYRRLKKSWFGLGTFSSERNSELGLDLRLQGGLGVGNEIVHTNSNNLLAALGVMVNKEWSSDTTEARVNVDGFVGVAYRLFRFKDPEIDITSNVTAYPSFTVKNRWRINFDIKVKIEIINDMYFSLSFYDNYDSKPASDAASNNDFGATTSLGYSF